MNESRGVRASSLAFDKEGRPFEFLETTHSLGVRRFRNPGGRGTCEVVFDDEGDPVHVDPASTVPEFRRAVGHVHGLYRLDQYDEEGDAITGAPAAYITIDPPRNGTPASSTDPLTIVRDIAQINGDVTKTFADKAAGMMDAVTACMRAAVVGGGLPSQRLLANAAPADARVEETDDDTDGADESHDGEGEEATPPAAPSDATWTALMALAPMVKPLLPKLGELLGAKAAELLNHWLGTSPAAASVSTMATVSAPPAGSAPSVTIAGGAAAGSGPGVPTDTTTAPSASPVPSSPPSSAPSAPETALPPAAALVGEPVTAPAVAELSTARATAPAAPTAPAQARNASVAPTPEQVAHLLAIRAALTPREAALVDGMLARLVQRGDTATQGQLLAELSGLPVDQAVERVRSLIREATQKAGR